MTLWDLYALVDDKTEEMRTFARIPNGDPAPETQVNGYNWIEMLTAMNEQEVQAEMNKYPNVSRAKC